MCVCYSLTNHMPTFVFAYLSGANERALQNQGGANHVTDRLGGSTALLDSPGTTEQSILYVYVSACVCICMCLCECTVCECVYIICAYVCVCMCIPVCVPELFLQFAIESQLPSSPSVDKSVVLMHQPENIRVSLKTEMESKPCLTWSCDQTTFSILKGSEILGTSVHPYSISSQC